MSREKSSQYGQEPKWILRALLVIAVTTVGFYLYVFDGGLSGSHGDWGEFGDYVGGVLNPVVALFALIVLVISLRQQAWQFYEQNFERTFFEMIRLHNGIVKDLDLRSISPKRVTVGRDCFRVFRDRLRKTYDTLQGLGPRERVVRAYDRFHDKHQHEVGHYFRNFYRILKFVDKSDVGVKEKRNYTGILRAQLSSYELLLMFYGTVHPKGKKLKPLLEKYAMFKNLETRLLFNSREETELFEQSAYGLHENPHATKAKVKRRGCMWELVRRLNSPWKKSVR